MRNINRFNTYYISIYDKNTRVFIKLDKKNKHSLSVKISAQKAMLSITYPESTCHPDPKKLNFVEIGIHMN